MSEVYQLAETNIRKLRRNSKRKVAEAKRSESNDSSANNSDSSEQDIKSVCKEVAMAENVHSLETNWSSMFFHKQIKFQVDTGADMSLLNEKSWVALGKPKLSKNTQRLRNASGNLISFKGTISNALTDIETASVFQQKKLLVDW